jgi:hypothetical protein
MKKIICSITLLFVFIAITYSQTEYETKAKEFVIQKMKEQSGGVLQLDSFAKTDGYDKEERGVKGYIMEFEGEMSATQSFWKNGNAFEGYWTSFQVWKTKPQADFNSAPQYYDASSRFKIIGYFGFQKTEKSLRIVNFKVKSVIKISNATATNNTVSQPDNQSAATTVSTGVGGQKMTQAQIDSQRFAEMEAKDNSNGNTKVPEQNNNTQKEKLKKNTGLILQKLLKPKK